MNALAHSHGPSDFGGDIYARVVEAIATQGYIILDDFLPPALIDALYTHYHHIGQETFRPAGVGREEDFHLNSWIRRDEIYWLNEAGAEVRSYFDWLEGLRLRINRELFLGLFDYECHYAYYPVGAFYKRHVDAFKGSSNRRLTTVLYLNPVWYGHDGGELLMYRDEELEPFETVQPQYGRMVIFLSEEFPHEVAVANKERYSLTGWFRVNGSTADNLDPPK